MDIKHEEDLLLDAVKRKEELAELIKPLLKQYRGAKKEIEVRKKRIARMRKQSSLKMDTQFVDTVMLDGDDLYVFVEN